MFLVGLTGGIATGKTVVANIFREFGIEVVDADVIAKKVVEPGKKAWKKIKHEFGPGVIKDSGEIDREKLGDIIFSTPEKRRRLDAITHPEIYKQIFWIVLQCFFKGHQFIVLDLPLLYESGVMVDYAHKIIVVSCDEKQQLDRLLDRNGLAKPDAMKRIKAQMSLEEKCKKANFIVDNSRSLEETRRQVESTYRVLRNSKHHWRLRLLLVVWFGTVTGLILWLTGFFSA